MRMEEAKKVNGKQQVVYVVHQELYKKDSSRTIRRIRDGDTVECSEVWWRARDSRENEPRKLGKEKAQAQSTGRVGSSRDKEK